MNAYELADQLEKDWDNSYTETCNMLRQQADRIAELEQNLSAYIVELELHKAMIQDLEKELRRTKFAWNLAENEIERLAPKTKPLSDEEIETIWMKRPANCAEDVLRFARAIEAKVRGEK